VRSAARNLVTCSPWPGLDATGTDAAQLAILRGYTTVNGVRMRPTAVVQDLLFGTSLAANPR
jgi:hypothetical protein